MDSCTTLTVAHHLRLHFPSTIALITQLSPITHCTDYTAKFHQTRFISFGLPLSHSRVLFRYCQYLWAFSLCMFPVDYLDCLYSSDHLLPALLTLPAFWIFYLSAACTDLCIVPGYVSALPSLLLLLLIERCLSDPLLYNKAAPGSQRHWPIITEYSAKWESSSFPKEPWPGMEPFNQLLDLKQGSSPIEEYVTQFCEISCKVPFDEVALKCIFRFGLSEPIKSCLPEGKFHCRNNETSMRNNLL